MKKIFILLSIASLLFLSNCEEEEEIILVHGTITNEITGSAATDIIIDIKGYEILGGLWPASEERHAVTINTNADGKFRVELPGNKKIEKVSLSLETTTGADLTVISGCPGFCDFEAKSNLQIDLVVSY